MHDFFVHSAYDDPSIHLDLIAFMHAHTSNGYHLANKNLPHCRQNFAEALFKYIFQIEIYFIFILPCGPMLIIFERWIFYFWQWTHNSQLILWMHKRISITNYESGSISKGQFFVCLNFNLCLSISKIQQWRVTFITSKSINALYFPLGALHDPLRWWHLHPFISPWYISIDLQNTEINNQITNID